MTAVVLLHGMLGAPSSMAPVRARLPEGARVVAPWLPAHGPSTAPLATTFDGAVRSLAAEVPAGAVVVGYSLGGRLALALAGVVALGGLVLVGAHAEPGDAARRAWDDEHAIAATESMSALVDRWERLPVFSTQTDAQRAAQRPTRLAHDGARIAWALSTLGRGRMPDLRPILASLTVPARVLVGARDAALVDAMRRLQLSPTTSMTVVPDRGHNLILEAPDVVAAAIESVRKELS